MRRTLALLLPFIVLVVSGCGGGAAPRSVQSPRTQRAPKSELELNYAAGSGSLIFFTSAGDHPTPVRELYAVFRGAPSSADLEAQRLAREDDFFGSEEHLGTPLYADTRLVSGSVNRGVYAFPTSKDALCSRSFPDGGGSCGTPGPHGLSVNYDDASNGAPFRIYGLVGDDVQQVDAVIHGTTRLAKLDENGYVLELRQMQLQDVTAFVLHLRNGETESVPFGPFP